MIQDDTRQTIKFVAWVIGLIIIAFFVSIAIFKQNVKMMVGFND